MVITSMVVDLKRLWNNNQIWVNLFYFYCSKLHKQNTTSDCLKINKWFALHSLIKILNYRFCLRHVWITRNHSVTIEKLNDQHSSFYCKNCWIFLYPILAVLSATGRQFQWYQNWQWHCFQKCSVNFVIRTTMEDCFWNSCIMWKTYNLGQNMPDKSTKLSNIGFFMKYFTADLLQHCSRTVKFFF